MMNIQPTYGMNYNQQIEVDFTAQISAAAKEKKTLNKPFRTPDGPKKFSVYVKNDKGNVVKVNFGDPNMEIKRDDPNRRKNFRARHQCDSNPGPKWKARYWSCRMWESQKSVTDYIKASVETSQANWDGETFWDQEELLTIWPELSKAQEMVEEMVDENEMENESEEELKEYKDEFFGMSVSSLQSIKTHVENVLNALENESVKENLTEPFLQAQIALAEDYVLTMHNYVMFNKVEEEEEEDEETYAKKFSPKMQPSTLDPKLLKKLAKISKQIAPPEEGHEGKNGDVSEDKQEYRKRAELTKWD